VAERRLDERVALVTGASRGAGKGIALVLGEEGAAVYLTGRSVRGKPTTLGRPGTIDGGLRALERMDLSPERAARNRVG